MPAAADVEIGLYGIRLAGLRRRGPSEPRPDAGWPRWTFAQVRGPADDAAGMTIDDGRARIGLPGTGELRLSAADRHIALHAPAPVPPATVEHPLLVPAAAAVAHWHGRAAVHAAAVLAGGAVWGLLGDGGAGKSTLAAELIRRGCVAFADDLLVVEGVTAYAGPPFIDLRADVAARFPARGLGEVGRRERWRLPAENDRLAAPLGGWVALERSAGPARIEPLAPRDRVRVLGAAVGLPLAGDRLLALADRPVLALRRSQASADDADLVLAALG